MSLFLPDITAVIVDTQDAERAVQTFNKVARLGVEFGNRILFKSKYHNHSGFKGEMVPLPIDKIQSKENYSRFIVKDLWKYIKTSHCLIMQWDGYILNPEVWEDRWLYWDYIGARWGFHKDHQVVGNGGFSLRSKKLMEIVGTDLNIVDTHPEDCAICRWYKPYLEQNYNLRWAPPAVADLFSDENSNFKHKCFGYHGGTR